MAEHKQIHSLVLDTGPIIKNDPAVSTLIQKAESLVTVPAIISEIKDAATRSRVETTLQPFLTIRQPSPKSIKAINDFARRTGDLAVLSKPDIEIIALTYELECERNGGDWRLRSVPGQKRMNGAPPNKAALSALQDGTIVAGKQTAEQSQNVDQAQLSNSVGASATVPQDLNADDKTEDVKAIKVDQQGQTQDIESNQAVQLEHSNEHDIPSESAVPAVPADLDLAVKAISIEESAVHADELDGSIQHTEVEEDGSDSDGWITPSNLKKQQAKDTSNDTVEIPEQAVLQAAVITSDYAMQNVILQMNLNLLSTNMQRIKHMKTFVLRCHACFQVSKDMNKQFCPRCGQPTLTRVSCSTNSNGEFKLHLKKNMQWNHRGDKYSVPKPVHGSSNGRMKGGGKGGWGNELILAEDQKEYERARQVQKRQKERNLMDEDYLPSILTGSRGKAGGRVKVGAGRNVNSKKR